MTAEIRRYVDGDRMRLRPLARAQFNCDTSADAYLDHLCGQAETGSMTMFVADGGDALAGYIAVSGPVPADTGNGTPGVYVMISDLFVDPVLRKRGLGTALTRRAEQEAAGCGATRVALKVLSENAAALGFYRAAGYADRFVVLDREVPGTLEKRGR